MKQQVQSQKNGFEKKTINALWNQYQRANGILWPYRGYFLPGIEGILISLARESFAAEQHR